jgi:hypothetical protein
MHLSESFDFVPNISVWINKVQISNLQACTSRVGALAGNGASSRQQGDIATSCQISIQ